MTDKLEELNKKLRNLYCKIIPANEYPDTSDDSDDGIDHGCLYYPETGEILYLKKYDTYNSKIYNKMSKLCVEYGQDKKYWFNNKNI
jgi:hypothetical protein